MDYIKFSVRISKILRDSLEAEAAHQERTLNQQLSIILKERYHAHAPPTTTQVKSSRARALPRVSRKQKQKAEIS